ncbi:MAG: FAD-binding oxidoreductase [Alphaproteobacteria bacterium]|nr:FAD-binding oxidoreductase [Alphaproteobacteria bacterium]
MSERFDVVIVGAGVSGASLAWQMKKRGVKRVLLAERNRPASGGTGKSAAIVRQHYSTPLMARMARASLDIFQTQAKACGFEQPGYLFLVPPDQAATAQTNMAMQRTVGVETEWLDPVALKKKAGDWLNMEGVGGATFEPKGGYADPVRTTETMVSMFKDLGGEFRERTPVRGLIRKGDRITGLSTDGGDIEADTVVNAAGPWSTMLAASANIEMQMRAIREQDTVWEARPGRPVPPNSISNAVDATYLRPLGGNRYVVGRGFPKEYFDCDPYNYKQTADDDFVAEVQRRLTMRFPTMEGAKLVDSYAALYDVTVDWYPYVGPRAGLQGYADFSGGSGHGFKIAPAIAGELAEWISAGTVKPDFARLSYDRIAKMDVFAGSYGGNRG